MEEERRKDWGKDVKELMDSMVSSCMSRIPREVVEHLANAQKEQLLALRSLIDQLIQRTEERIKKDEEFREKNPT